MQLLWSGDGIVRAVPPLESNKSRPPAQKKAFTYLVINTTANLYGHH